LNREKKDDSKWALFKQGSTTETPTLFEDLFNDYKLEKNVTSNAVELKWIGPGPDNNIKAKGFSLTWKKSTSSVEKEDLIEKNKTVYYSTLICSGTGGTCPIPNLENKSLRTQRKNLCSVHLRVCLFVYFYFFF